MFLRIQETRLVICHANFKFLNAGNRLPIASHFSDLQLVIDNHW